MPHSKNSADRTKPKIGVENKARRPFARTGREACEGIGSASPSNPNQEFQKLAAEILNSRVEFRCSSDDRDHLFELAKELDQSVSLFLRDLVRAPSARKLRRRKLNADPKLLRILAGIGSNMNQLALHANRAAKIGSVAPIDALGLFAQLVSMERTLLMTLENINHAD